MISRSLTRLSRSHPAAALSITAVILVGGTAALVVLTIRDLSAGHLMRPVAALAILILVSIRLASAGLRRRV